MITTKEIAWVAGLLEGEGCFKLNRKSPQIALAMTDRDTVERVAAIWGSQVTAWAKRPCNKKQPFFTGIQGRKAAEWMMTVYTLMGERRKARIKEVLAAWKALKPRYAENTICGHVDLPYCARGMCQRCYDRSRYPRKVVA